MNLIEVFTLIFQEKSWHEVYELTWSENWMSWNSPMSTWSVAFILWGARMYLQNVMTIHPIVVELFQYWNFQYWYCCTWRVWVILWFLLQLIWQIDPYGVSVKVLSNSVDFLFLKTLVWPGARSFAWLDERASGRLWRSRFIRLKPMGISGSDMVSRFSADAKDTLLAWSARAGCVGLSRVTRGVRVCKTQDKKLGKKTQVKRENSSWWGV